MHSELDLSPPRPFDVYDDAHEFVPDDAEPTYRTGFVLFGLVTAVLFLRPSELLPALKDVPIYEPLIIACLIASLPLVLAQLTWQSLAARPLTLCVLAMLPCVFLSNALQSDLYRARTGALDFLKLVIYFLLLVGLVNTPGRLRSFLTVITVFVFAIMALALLQHHHIIHIEALTPMEQKEGVDEWTGTRLTTVRLQSSGIFNDPNDFSLILVAGVLLCLHRAFEMTGTVARLPYLATIGAFLYALALTRSRGGFLALVAGLAVYSFSRVGWRRTLVLAIVVLPALFFAFGGRQTNINVDDEDDSGHARVVIWREGFELLKAAPVFGAGYGAMSREIGYVAHNSFVHCYTELGLVGGTFFFGAFYLPLRHLRKRPELIAEFGDDGVTDAMKLRVCLFAMLASYAIGLCSLSRAYTVTTYLILGIAGAYCALTSPPPDDGGAEPGPTPGPFPRLIAMSVLFLAALIVFTKATA